MTDKAIERVKDMIVRGDLRPGQRLPPEKQLSEALGLSRSSLREAIKALEVMRVVDVRRGDGTFVTSLEPQLLLEAMSFVTELHTDDSVLEAFAVRRMLEPATASLAAATIDPAQLSGLRHSLDSVATDAEVTDLVAHDLDFHRRIAAATGNAYLTSLLDALSAATVRARVWRGLTESGAVTRTLDEHRSILVALERHDGALAHASMYTHITGVEQWLRKVR